MTRRRDRLGPLSLVSLLTVACAHGSRGATDECTLPAEEAAQPVDPAQLAGDYALTLAASEGLQAGASIEGLMTLRPQLDSLRQVPGPGGAPYPDVTNPLVGTMMVAVDSVGAMVAGDLTSLDPTAPGVAVLVRPGETLLRLGSTANRRGVFQFDGPFTVLRVYRAADDGFVGTWSSGGGDQRAGGYFCAVRS